MYCKHCGTQLRDDAKFCASCGNAVEQQVQESPVYTEAPAVNYSNETVVLPEHQPIYEAPQQPAINEEIVSNMQSSILTFGILALAFAVTFAVSFMGIIFGAITASKVKEYVRLVGETTGRATVGKNLGKAGLIVGIIMTAVFIIYIIAIVALIVYGVSSPSSYYYYY